MTVKPQLSGGTSARAGVPLARAQRLAAATDAPQRKSVLPAVLVATALVALLGGAVMVAGPTLTPSASPPTAAADATVPTTSAPKMASIGAPAAAPAPALPPLVDAPRTAPIVASPENARLPAAPAALELADLKPLEQAQPQTCLERVENRLVELQSIIGAPSMDLVPKDALSGLMQASLDCPGVGLEIDGSLELASSDFADVLVLWNPDAPQLLLSVIDRSATEDLQPIFTENGVPTEFVVR
ncbi:MAG: hypothetical protein AAF646_15055 [Pseudomonadota bacterium]